MSEQKITPKSKIVNPITYNEYADILLPKMNLITNSIIEAFQNGIKPNEFSVFLLIESYNQNKVEVPSPPQLANSLKMTERNFHNIIKELNTKGLLELKGKKTKRIYDFSKLKALMHIR